MKTDYMDAVRAHKLKDVGRAQRAEIRHLMSITQAKCLQMTATTGHGSLLRAFKHKEKLHQVVK
ncbi:MAG: hypothetical protein Q8J96_13005 [Rhodocyclaceae bacterium]|nr:hypothetical protein [Rhodocyclaceae bacterium]